MTQNRESTCFALADVASHVDLLWPALQLAWQASRWIDNAVVCRIMQVKERVHYIQCLQHKHLVDFSADAIES